MDTSFSRTRFTQILNADQELYFVLWTKRKMSINLYSIWYNCYSYGYSFMQNFQVILYYEWIKKFFAGPEVRRVVSTRFDIWNMGKKYV